MADVLAGDPDEIAARLERDLRGSETQAPRGRAQPCGASPTRPVRGGGAHGSRSTSAPGTRSRSCSRSGRSGRRRRRRSSSTARCGASTRRRTSSCSSSASSRSSARRRRRSSSARTAARASTRSPARPQPGEGDAERLLASEKDRAEHVMLVDLGRNDLSRVCGPAPCTSRAPSRRSASRTSRTSSRRSSGELRDGVSPFDLLRACFPAGTVSGAPKVRAMQIVSELEGYRRGPYAGAVGYVLPDGTMDTCIAIRTIVLADGVARLQAGAGIVADSDPAAEHHECLRSSPRSRPRSTSRRRAPDAPDGRQLRLVHLQPRAPVPGARRRGASCSGTTRSPSRRPRRSSRRSSSSPPAPAGPRTRASRSS